MNITMDDSRLITIIQLREFLKASQKVTVSLSEKPLVEKYKFITKTIHQFSYHTLSKKEKRFVYLYIRKLTGYKKAQLYLTFAISVLRAVFPTKVQRIVG